MPKFAEWTCAPYDPVEAAALEDALGLSPAAASILVRRGLGDPDAASSFLSGTEPSDPMALPGASDACDLVLDHVRQSSPILVFGDYDVDGVCSTAMMVGALRAIGADPSWQLPNRLDDGYGLSEDAVRKMAASGVRLLVTVDCGITAAREVALARELGIEVLITDHHRPGERLPDCAVVHPALDPGENWPEHTRDLCAAGVVLKLSEALRTRAGLDPRDADEDLDLAGLATICDMVPLRGENRRIARAGLDALARTRRPGLRALMRAAGVEAGDIDASTASFRLGPRLNAAGRLHRADAALELLMTADEERAAEVARELDRLNLDRRLTEQRILFQAEAACRDQLSAAAIVVAGEDWHPGVVGIVASRLVELHRRPCVVIALNGGEGRGSARSISPYDVHEGIAAGAEHLKRFGGHRMAAGLEIDAAQVDAFRRALARHAAERLAPGDLVPVQRVDAVVSPAALNLDLAEEMDCLGPFGAANPAPALLVPAARIEHVTAMGEEGDHARFSLAGGSGRARGVAFRTSQRGLAAAGAAPHDAAVSLERNRWNGAVEARVVLRSISATRPGRLQDVGPPEEFWSVVASEMACDPIRWCDEAASGDEGASGHEAACGEAKRPAEAKPVAGSLAAAPVRDRLNEGIAAVATELLTSGRRVLVLVAELGRRRAGLERLLAGAAPDARLAVLSWEALMARRSLASPYEHLLALDPPPVSEAVSLATGAPGVEMLHLAWGQAERDFTLAHWRAQLDLRPLLTELWRALADGSVEGDDLERVLRGSGTYPRGGRVCGRMLRVLCELGLAEYTAGREAAQPACRRLGAARTDLSLSAANRAYTARLQAVESYLAAKTPVPTATAASAG